MDEIKSLESLALDLVCQIHDHKYNIRVSRAGIRSMRFRANQILSILERIERDDRKIFD